MYQNSGLDDSPALESSGPGGSSPISVEIVTGLKEQLYWMGLPEKVRQDALRRWGEGVHVVDEPIPEGRKRRRKG